MYDILVGPIDTCFAITELEIAVDNKVVGSLQNQKKHYELQSEALQLSQP